MLGRYLCCLGVIVAFAGVASAQFGGGGGGARPQVGGFGGGGQQYNFNAGPTVSPYLQLLRPGGSPALNYFTLVQPQLNFQQGLQNLQQQFSAGFSMLSGGGGGGGAVDPTSNVSGTGSRFLNTRGYFQSFNGQGGAARTTTGANAAAPAYNFVHPGLVPEPTVKAKMP